MSRTLLDKSLIPTIAQLSAYRRPNLVFFSTAAIQPEPGLFDGNASNVTVLFSDGDLRTETNSQMWRGDTTRVAVFNNASINSNQSGLRTGTVTANTWYYCYAVKITTFTGRWVFVFDTVAPTVANFATLNSNFGTNGWSYLGVLPYGDGSGASTGFPTFDMCGDTIAFRNNCTLANRPGTCVRLANTASATALTWSYAVGTALGSGQIPETCLIGGLVASMGNSGANNLGILTGDLNSYYFEGVQVTGSGHNYNFANVNLTRGMNITPNATIAMSIGMTHYTDQALRK